MKFHFLGRKEAVKKDLIQPLQNLGLDMDFIDPDAYTPNLAGAKGREFLIVGPDDFKTYANKLKFHRGFIVNEERVGRFYYPGLKVESSAVLFCEEMIAQIMLKDGIF